MRIRSVIDSDRFMYYGDEDGTIHIVLKHWQTTICGKKKTGWQRVPEQRVDCEECADALRALLFREAEVILGYDKYREFATWSERQQMREAG